MKRLFWTLAILSSISGVLSCSEKAKAPPPTTTPVAVVLYPPNIVTNSYSVGDSVDVYVAAADLTLGKISGGVSKVQFWFVSPDTSQFSTLSTQFGESGTPLAQVPDSVKNLFQVPDGYQLYATRWHMGPKQPGPGFVWTYIPTGTYVQIFALAQDASGNRGRSGLVRLGVFNHGNLFPPNACFTVNPTTGIAQQTSFAFDASCTHDLYDLPSKVEVRWSFSGDSTKWDVGDWSQPGYTPVHPTEIQYHTFPQPHLYVVLMQARNSYLPLRHTTAPRQVLVQNKGGTARPPNPLEYVTIPSGINFPMGATTYTVDDSLFPANQNEMPVHWVQLSPKAGETDYISKFDVTNTEYVNYIDSALVASSIDPNNPSIKRPPQLLFQNGVLMYKDQVPPVDTTWVFMDMSSANTKIFYDLTTKRFTVASGYENNPVTGVSWYGASAYCLYYGLRLPTEAEWEFCARGDHLSLNYPFAGGTKLSKTTGWRKVNYRGSWIQRGGIAGTTPVGYFNGINPNTDDTPSILGLYDMAGDVGQWVDDWLSGYPVPPVGADSLHPVYDPQGPTSGDPIYGNAKVIRGGSYQSSRAGVRCTVRNGEGDLEQCFPDVGFRTAYTLLTQ